MKETDVQSKIIELNESLDLIEKELRWLLEESTRRDVPPNSPEGDEFLRMFFSLYHDFLGLRQKIVKFARDVKTISFTDETMGLVYQTTADYMARKLGKGIFEQFISVAETGKLPGNDVSA